MSEEAKEILFQLEIVARKHTIKVTDTGNAETMPASVVDELRLNNYSAKILLNYITNLQKDYERIYNENCKLREQHNINDISLLDELQDYKQRNEKAVEYLEKHKDKTGWVELSPFTTEETNLPDLLNILQGGDE